MLAVKTDSPSVRPHHCDIKSQQQKADLEPKSQTDIARKDAKLIKPTGVEKTLSSGNSNKTHSVPTAHLFSFPQIHLWSTGLKTKTRTWQRRFITNADQDNNFSFRWKSVCIITNKSSRLHSALGTLNRGAHFKCTLNRGRALQIPAGKYRAHTHLWSSFQQQG